MLRYFTLLTTVLLLTILSACKKNGNDPAPSSASFEAAGIWSSHAAYALRDFVTVKEEYSSVREIPVPADEFIDMGYYNGAYVYNSSKEVIVRSAATDDTLFYTKYADERVERAMLYKNHVLIIYQKYNGTGTYRTILLRKIEPPTHPVVWKINAEWALYEFYRPVIMGNKLLLCESYSGVSGLLFINLDTGDFKRFYTRDGGLNFFATIAQKDKFGLCYGDRMDVYDLEANYIESIPFERNYAPIYSPSFAERTYNGYITLLMHEYPSYNEISLLAMDFNKGEALWSKRLSEIIGTFNIAHVLNDDKHQYIITTYLENGTPKNKMLVLDLISRETVRVEELSFSVEPMRFRAMTRNHICLVGGEDHTLKVITYNKATRQWKHFSIPTVGPVPTGPGAGGAIIVDEQGRLYIKGYRRIFIIE